MEVFMCACCKRIVPKNDNGADPPSGRKMAIERWAFETCDTCYDKIREFFRSIMVEPPAEHRS